MPKSPKSADDWLPTDEELFARTKTWSNFFSKYSIEEDESLGIELNEDTMAKLWGSDDSESKETISASEFVDDEEQEDPNFDMEKLLDQTMKVIEKRKRKWGRSGFDKLMESSFCMDEYSKKVDHWLDGNSRYFPMEHKRHRNGKLPCINEAEIRDHRVYMERSSSQESDASVDTVKYILSNKKKQKTRYRTMTIKEYCYSRRRMEEREQSCRKKVSMGYDGRIANFGGKRISLPELNYAARVTPSHRPRYNSEPVKQKFRKRHRAKSPLTGLSSDSSSSSDYKSEDAGRFRRSRHKKKTCYKKPPPSRESPAFDDQSETRISEIRFCPENVVNSTALSNKVPSFTSRKELNPISEENEGATTHNSTEENYKNKTLCSPIVIYTPEDVSKHFQSSINNGKILLTSKVLEDIIGSELAKIYLNLKKDFSYEFDQHSKILFYPPEEVVETSDSEADILERISSNRTGRIVEILNAK